MNTDRALLLELLKSGHGPVAVTSNPLAEDLGTKLIELDTERRSALLSFEPTARYTQGAGVLQGGAIAVLLDFAMAFAAYAVPEARERSFATATLSVSLLRPAWPGRYLARGRIVRAGRRLLFAEGSLVAAEDPRTSATGSLPTTEDPRATAKGSPIAEPGSGVIVATASAVMPFTDGG